MVDPAICLDVKHFVVHKTYITIHVLTAHGDWNVAYVVCKMHITSYIPLLPHKHNILYKFLSITRLTAPRSWIYCTDTRCFECIYTHIACMCDNLRICGSLTSLSTGSDDSLKTAHVEHMWIFICKYHKYIT